MDTTTELNSDISQETKLAPQSEKETSSTIKDNEMKIQIQENEDKELIVNDDKEVSNEKKEPIVKKEESKEIQSENKTDDKFEKLEEISNKNSETPSQSEQELVLEKEDEDENTQSKMIPNKVMEENIESKAILENIKEEITQTKIILENIEEKVAQQEVVLEQSKVLSENVEKSLEQEFAELGLTEKEALELLKEEENEKAKPRGTLPKIQIYGSSVSGNMKIKRAQNKILDTLDRFKIKYEFMDLAADDEAKLYIRRKNPTSTNIPQLYIDGEFRMEYEEFEELLEYDELFDALGVEPDF